MRFISKEKRAKNSEKHDFIKSVGLIPRGSEGIRKRVKL